MEYSFLESFETNMVFLQITVVFHALIAAIGVARNFLTILTIALERRIHVMQFILLSSLAVSDMFFASLSSHFVSRHMAGR